MWNLRPFILFALLLPSLSWAGKCGNSNLLTVPDSPFNKLPVYDQDGSGLCYAYASAQLADYHLMATGKTKERTIHPFWVAMSSTTKAGSKSMDGGTPKMALEAISEEPNCQYRTVQASLKEWTKSTGIQETQLIDIIERASPRVAGMQNLKGNLTSEDFKEVLKATLDEYTYCPIPESNFGQIITELEKLLKDIPLNIAKEHLRACEASKEKVTLPTVLEDYKDSPEDWSNLLSSRLDEFKSPVAVVFCGNVLKDPKYRGISMGEYYRDQYAQDCQMHSSLVVGNRESEGKCQFLVRNSYGSGFSQYTDPYKCFCRHRKTGEVAEDCHSSTHNDGQWTVEGCWMDSEDLTSNIAQSLTIPR